MKSGQILDSLARRARRLKRPDSPLPPGFDAALYCALNPDVAQACPDPEDAARHYLRHGRAELRRILPEGAGIHHPESRMIQSVTARRNWVEWLRGKAPGTKIDALLKAHPRAPWLETGFVLSAYLLERPDVAGAIDAPLQAAFHYLEFGLEEGAQGHPEEADPRHLKRQYGALFDDLPRNVAPNVDAVLRRLREAGHDGLHISLSEPAYWELHGFSGTVLAAQFDHEVYHAIAQRAGLAGTSGARLACIRHFCTTGAEAGLPAHPDLAIDPRFYLEHWLDVMAKGDKPDAEPPARTVQDRLHLSALAQQIGTAPASLDALRAGAEPDDPGLKNRLALHFLRKGARLGAAANLPLWVQRSFRLRIPGSLVTRLLAQAFSGQSQVSPIAGLQRMLTQPMQHLDYPPELEAAEASFLLDQADRLAVRGANDQAEWLYRMVLSQHPDHERGLNHLADLMRRMGRAGAESQLRVQSRALPGPKRAGGVWNLLSLAERALEDELVQQAIELLEQSAAACGGDMALCDKHQSLSARLFRLVWDQIGSYADAHGIAQAQQHLSEVLALATPSFHGPIPERGAPVRRVALVGNVDLPQCKLYRVDQKAEQLRAAGFEVHIFHPYQEIEQFRTALPELDAAIFFRLPAFPEIMAAITECAAYGVPTFYEIDDLLFDAAHFPPPFDTYAGRINQAQYRDIACAVPLYAHALKLCDYAIGSTRTLCEHMAPYVRSGRAFEHHNALGALHYNSIAALELMPPRAEGGPLVLFYGSGTLAHKEDFREIMEPALAEILRRYKGKVEVQLVGSFGTFRHLDPRRDALRFMQPDLDFEQYCLMLAGADINLSVLSSGVVTDTKSEIKWMEAAMFGVPSVLSRTATHEDVIEDGKTGFLCDTKQDFIRALSALIEDTELRQRVGEAARTHALTHYSHEAMGQNLRKMFEATQVPTKRNKPRLVVVNVFYPPQAIGGATRVVEDNIRTLRADFGEMFDIQVICTIEGAKPYSLHAFVQDGVPVWGIGAPDQGGTEMTARDPGMEPLFGGLLDRLAPDLVHFHCIQRLTSSAVDATRKRDIPYIITLHDGWWISPRQFLLDPDTDTLERYDYAALSAPDAPPRARILWPALSGAKRLLAVSEAFAQVHRECNLPQVLACENGVSDLPEVTREPHPGGRVRLALLGGTERHKGLHLLRNALLAHEFANLEMLIIDHALKPDQILREVWGTTPVTCRGKVPQSQVTDLYARIDVLFAPSVWPEAYGLVTREALATGAWVVASDRGGVGTDVIEGVNGHVVGVDDSSQIARVLRLIDENPGRYQSPPAQTPALRPARAQAHELAAHYAQLLGMPPPTEPAAP